MDRDHETNENEREDLSDEPKCECTFKVFRRPLREVRVDNPRCPVHGKRRHLRLVR